MSAILLFEDRICAQGVRVLHEIEHIAGRDCLTKGYAKLQHICSTCVKIAEACKSSVGGDAATLTTEIRSCILYALQAIWFSLHYEMIQSKNITVQELDTKRDGTPGLVHLILARRAVLGFVLDSMKSLREVDDAAPLVAEMDDLLQFFSDYPAFEHAFQKKKCQGDASTLAAPLVQQVTMQGSDEEADGSNSENGSNQLEWVLEKYKSKPTHLLGNLLFDLLSGTVDDKLKKAIAGVYNLAGFDFASKDGMDALRDWKRALTMYQTIVPVLQTKKMDAPGLSTATSELNDAEALEKSAERTRVWLRAQAKRKSLVSVGFVKVSTKQHAQSYYEKCQAVYRFPTKDREAHRVFLFSAELWTESRQTPWAATPPYEESARPLLDFMLCQTGVGDVLCLMDGRSKTWRRKFEDIMQEANARNTTEVWIIYRDTASHVVATKKYSFACENREVALLSMSVSRNHLPCKPRNDPCRNAGESSTHATTYSGVEPMNWRAMQLLSKADKEKIFGFDVQTPRMKRSAATPACPLYWQEKKTHTFWAAILSDLGAKVVFDCTPGSGLCARACMDRGITYACLARSQHHSTWLQNVLDRAAVISICTSQSALYTQDLATCIEEHFKEVVRQVKDQDQKQMEKVDSDEDDEDGFEFACEESK